MIDSLEKNLEKMIKATTTFVLDQAGEQWMKVIGSEKRKQRVDNYIKRAFMITLGLGVPLATGYEFSKLNNTLKVYHQSASQITFDAKVQTTNYITSTNTLK